MPENKHYVLTEESTVICAHSGSVNVAGAGDVRLKVKGKSVLIKSSVEGRDVSKDCILRDSQDTSGTVVTKQCTKVVQVTGGEATKLTIGGHKVLLDTLAGTTDGFQEKTVIQRLGTAHANQAKLSVSERRNGARKS